VQAIHLALIQRRQALLSAREADSEVLVLKPQPVVDVVRDAGVHAVHVGAEPERLPANQRQRAPGAKPAQVVRALLRVLLTVHRERVSRFVSGFNAFDFLF
jgi:hypothetical protein